MPRYYFYCRACGTVFSLRGSPGEGNPIAHCTCTRTDQTTRCGAGVPGLRNARRKQRAAAHGGSLPEPHEAGDIEAGVWGAIRQCHGTPMPDRAMTDDEFRTELLALLGELSETWRGIGEDIQKICKEHGEKPLTGDPVTDVINAMERKSNG